MQSQPAAHFQATNTALIRLAVEAYASAPHFTAVERQARSEAVICGIMAFLPSEPVQTMLASQAVGQHLLALDTIREVFHRSLTENASIRMRLTAATCTRSTLSLMRELRVVRAEYLAAVLADQAAMDAHVAGQTPAEADHGTDAPGAAETASPESAAESCARPVPMAAAAADETSALQATPEVEAPDSEGRIAAAPATAAFEPRRNSAVRAVPSSSADAASGRQADGKDPAIAVGRENLASDAALLAASLAGD